MSNSTQPVRIQRTTPGRKEIVGDLRYTPHLRPSPSCSRRNSFLSIRGADDRFVSSAFPHRDD